MLIHGHYGTPTYKTWRQVIRRCYDMNFHTYTHYGAKGIKVCGRWRHSFANFLYDMGERPTIKHQIDRIKNSKGYSPANCRWVTRVEQMNNKTTNHRITWRGKTQTLAQWARELGFGRTIIKDRLTRYGWTINRALSTPLDPVKLLAWQTRRSNAHG